MKKQPQHREDKKPFFARFLEGQELNEVQGAKPEHTLKYPSDNDEI